MAERRDVRALAEGLAYALPDELGDLSDEKLARILGDVLAEVATREEVCACGHGEWLHMRRAPDVVPECVAPGLCCACTAWQPAGTVYRLVEMREATCKESLQVRAEEPAP